MGLRKREISIEGVSLKMLIVNAERPNFPEYYAFSSIKSIVPLKFENLGRANTTGGGFATYPFVDMYQIVINFNDESDAPSIKFDLADISNQPSWTVDDAGLDQALEDLNSWASIAATGGTTSLANTSSTFATPVLFIKNVGGIISSSTELNGTYVANAGPHVPSNVKSYYITNLGLDGAGVTVNDVDYDNNGVDNTIAADELSISDNVSDDKNSLSGNISITGLTLDHIVKVQYRILV